MKTIKNILRLFLAACCLLFASCNDPSSSSSNDTDISIPQGMGYVRLNVIMSNERTIVPGTIKDDFLSYLFVFTNTNNSAHDQNIPRSKANLSDPVFLEPGNYTLSVTAFMGAVQTNPAASGSVNLAVSPGSGINSTVLLRPFTNAGNGTFRYNITIPAALGVSAANMKITPLSPNGTDEQTVNILTAGNSTRTLNSGCYSVTFTLAKTNTETVIWRDVLYVYQNMESRFDYTFTEAHFSGINYEVTFVFNNGNINITQDILRGEELNEPPEQTWDKGEFIGWYTDIAFTNKVTFPVTLTGDITLYAKWEVDSEFNIEWDYDDSKPILFMGSVPVLPDSDVSILRGSSVIFTVTNAPSFDSGSIKWYCGNEQAGAGAVFTFDTAESRFNRTGVILLTIEADKDGMRYSTYTSINVVQANIVTFDADNEDPLAYQYVTVGDLVIKPADPVKAQAPIEPGLYLTVSGQPASVFTGWFNEDDVEFDFTAVVITDNITLKAHWSDPSPIDVSTSSGTNDIEKSFSYVNTTANASRGPYTLYLNNGTPENISARSLSVSNARLTIMDFGDAERVIQYNGAVGSSLVTISASTAGLTLGNNITIRGGSANSTTFLVSVSSGTFNMLAGSKISGHKTNSASGTVNVSGGTFNMSGGEITGNRTTNAATAASGGVILSSGTFNMRGGKIHGNTRNYIDDTDPGLPSDIYVSTTTAGALSLSGNAEPGVITLYSSSTSSYSGYNSSITLNRWTGLASLNLRGNVAALESVPGYWEFHKQIIRAASGYALTSQDISRITLGSFLSTTAADNSRSASDTHNIAGGQINAIIGTLMPINAQIPVISSSSGHPVSAFYIKGCNFRTPLTVSASLNDGGLLSYQWYSNTENSVEGGTPVGVNNARYVPDNLNETMYYYCVITNNNVLSVGDQTAKITTNIASIEIRNLPEATVFIDIEDREQDIPFLDLDSALKLFSNSSTVFVTPAGSPSYPSLPIGNYTFRIIENQPIAGQTLGSYQIVSRDVIFTPNNPLTPVEIQPSGTSTFLTLFSDLTLDNGITIKGQNSSTSPLISVYYSTSNLNMREGSKITGHRNTSASSFGGAVYVAGTLNMSGGEISGNTVTAGEGGGVYVASGGSINIGGNAKIINNVKETGSVSAPNNVSLFFSRSITVGNAAVPIPASGMQVGVSGLGVVATGITTGYANRFTKDAANFSLTQQGDNLMLGPTVGTAVVLDMRDSNSDGWDGNGALRINVNGTDIASSVKVNSSSSSIYIFFVNHGDIVQFYWVAGAYQSENAFIAHYYNNLPNPAFNPSSWSGSNALIHRLYNTMGSTANGELLGTFTVP